MSIALLPGFHVSGNNAPILLWQFLLEMLADKNCQDIIQWEGDEGVFKLINPAAVAQRWGARKGGHATPMPYQTFARALRHYYGGDMLAKVRLNWEVVVS